MRLHLLAALAALVVGGPAFAQQSSFPEIRAGGLSDELDIVDQAREDDISTVMVHHARRTGQLLSVVVMRRPPQGDLTAYTKAYFEHFIDRGKLVRDSSLVLLFAETGEASVYPRPDISSSEEQSGLHKIRAHLEIGNYPKAVSAASELLSADTPQQILRPPSGDPLVPAASSAPGIPAAAPASPSVDLANVLPAIDWNLAKQVGIAVALALAGVLPLVGLTLYALRVHRRRQAAEAARKQVRNREWQQRQAEFSAMLHSVDAASPSKRVRERFELAEDRQRIISQLDDGQRDALLVQEDAERRYGARRTPGDRPFSGPGFAWAFGADASPDVGTCSDGGGGCE
jgi:hypothetical protein